MEKRDLTDQELAQLHVKFVVPFAVKDMLEGTEILDDVAEFTLHDIIGGMQPDTALLCLALCAQHIAARVTHIPLATALYVESSKIIDDYGFVWLANEAGKQDLVEEELHELLMHTPEDLEAIGDLFLAVGQQIEEDHAVSAILCEIFGLQAHSHQDMAEWELQAMPLSVDEIQPAISQTQESAKIIPFPVRKD